MINYIIQILFNLSLTLIIETIVALLLKVRNKNDLLNVLIVNYITNPIINILMIIIMCFIKSNIIINSLLFIFELLVVYYEYVFYKKRLIYNKINLLLFSFILNVCSFLSGYVILFIVNYFD